MLWVEIVRIFVGGDGRPTLEVYKEADNESDPNHANYDEATANPYPDLPEVRTLKNGKKVTSAKMWKGLGVVRSTTAEIYSEFDRTTPAPLLCQGNFETRS